MSGDSLYLVSPTKGSMGSFVGRGIKILPITLPSLSSELLSIVIVKCWIRRIYVPW